MTKRDFYIKLEHYVYINNEVYGLDWMNPTKLNTNLKINDRTWTKQLGFRTSDYERLPVYRGFISEPGHGDDYQQVVGDQWNLYHMVDWDPKPGEWPTIHKLLNHLYGANGVEADQLEEIYDYHTIMMRWPKHKLFARVLYSHTQGTAKSALAVLESCMFEANYVKLRADQFEEKYNSIWADRLIIHLDEPAFNQPQKMSRNIRDFITTPHVSVRRMNTDAIESAFHGKFLITTNDTNFMSFEDSDRRYWIREVPAIPEKDMDPMFMTKLKEEVNHYLHFLLMREMKYSEKQDGTFWLPRQVLYTEGNSKLVGDNVSDANSTLVEHLEDWFLNDKARKVCCFKIDDLMQAVEWGRREPSKSDIKIFLREKLGAQMPDKTPNRINKGEHYLLPGSDYAKTRKQARFIKVSRDQFNLEVDIFNTETIKA